jgi:hypothetical protein
MRKQIALGILALTAGLAASGCGEGSDAEAESPPVTTRHVEANPRTHLAVEMSQFRAAFKKAYGERPWYGQITGMKLTQITATKAYRTLEIRMTEREIDVGTICQAVFSTARILGVRDGINAVHVIRSDGKDGGCA